MALRFGTVALMLVVLFITGCRTTTSNKPCCAPSVVATTPTPAPCPSPGCPPGLPPGPPPFPIR